MSVALLGGCEGEQSTMLSYVCTNRVLVKATPHWSYHAIILYAVQLIMASQWMFFRALQTNNTHTHTHTHTHPPLSFITSKQTLQVHGTNHL